MNLTLACIFILRSLMVIQLMQAEEKSYSVKKIHSSIDITGKGEAPEWKEAVALTDFIYPWEKDTPSYTSFKSLHDKEWIYFLFEVEDHHINLYTKLNNKRDAVRSDRVEIFFKQDDTMNPYYCLEMDAMARVFDCRGTHYRKIDPQWSWPEGQLDVKSHRHDKGYSVELRISKSSLKDLGLLQHNRLFAGIFRADCYEISESNSEFHWISWVNPGTPEPDFHIASAFGRLDLDNN